MNAFVTWLLGKNSQAETDGGTGRSFRSRISWCWDIPVPQPVTTGEIHRQILVDGTYFGSWCVLIAHNGSHVIGWQWCTSESKASWGQLLKRLPAPDVVVTDGGTGLRSALDRYWRRTKIQRCYFHIFQTVKRHVTLNPRLDAGKEALALTRDLMDVHDLDAAAKWMGAYASWESRWSDLMKERTYVKAGIDRPTWAKPTQRWWYTHRGIRRVRALYRQLIKDESLFTWLDDAYLEGDQRTVERTTSRLEGGPNTAVKRLLRDHRGLSEPHARRAIDWRLNSLTEHPYDPWALAQQHFSNQTTRPKQVIPQEPLGPAEYDTNPTAEEGLWARKGWGGRWQP